MRIKPFLAPILTLSAISGSLAVNHSLGICPTDQIVSGLALQFLHNSYINNVIKQVATLAALALAVAVVPPIGDALESIGRSLEKLLGQKEIREEARIQSFNRREATDLDATAGNPCAICLENFAPGDQVFSHQAINGIHHTIHTVCKEELFFTDDERQRTHRCPLCRVPLILDDY